MHDKDNLDSERVLLQRIAEGDGNAFRQLFDQYRDFIYSFALRMTESDTISKDVVQEVFIKIWLQRETLSSLHNLPAYINRLTRNHVLNGIKRKAFETTLLKDLHAGEPDIKRNTPEETLLNKELENLMSRAINHLPKQQQKVYRMSRMDGLKHEEIARELQISRETVKKHMMAAILSMQHYIRIHGGPVSILAICFVGLSR
ncbi:RNA polymerase sigma-70 factor [Chitinophaga sp. MM2321]|uniref:RNA polymerase sigma factor n=1 Tax=Chitinophaga sp. MM2321 TaxID=3137178 RepID=UPI0032D56D33